MKVIKVGGGCLNGKKTIARIIDLYSVDSKAIAQPMRADTSNLAGLRVNQLAQSCPTGALSNY